MNPVSMTQRLATSQRAELSNLPATKSITLAPISAAPASSSSASTQSAAARAPQPTARLDAAGLSALIARLGSPLVQLTGDPLIDAMAVQSADSEKMAGGKIADAHLHRSEKLHDESERLKHVLDVIKEQRSKGFWDKLVTVFEVLAAVASAVTVLATAGASGGILAATMVALKEGALAAGTEVGLALGGSLAGQAVANYRLSGSNASVARSDIQIEEQKRLFDLAKSSLEEHFNREARVVGQLRSTLDARHAARSAAIAA